MLINNLILAWFVFYWYFLEKFVCKERAHILDLRLLEIPFVQIFPRELWAFPISLIYLRLLFHYQARPCDVSHSHSSIVSCFVWHLENSPLCSPKRARVGNKRRGQLASEKCVVRNQCEHLTQYALQVSDHKMRHALFGGRFQGYARQLFIVILAKTFSIFFSLA